MNGVVLLLFKHNNYLVFVQKVSIFWSQVRSNWRNNYKFIIAYCCFFRFKFQTQPQSPTRLRWKPSTKKCRKQLLQSRSDLGDGQILNVRVPEHQVKTSIRSQQLQATLPVAFSCSKVKKGKLYFRSLDRAIICLVPFDTR